VLIFLIMTSRTHDMIGFASLITVAANFPPENLNVNTAIASLIGCTIGSLIPDMDQATNRLWDLLPAGNFLGRIFRNLMLEHRTISHSILGGYILYKILSFVILHLINPNYVDIELVTISIMVGFVAHVCADMLTKEGVPLLFPLPFKIGFPPIKALRITTGKFVEKVLIFPGVIVYLIWFVAYHRVQLLSLLKLIQS